VNQLLDTTALDIRISKITSAIESAGEIEEGAMGILVGIRSSPEKGRQ